MGSKNLTYKAFSLAATILQEADEIPFTSLHEDASHYDQVESKSDDEESETLQEV